MKRAAVVCEGMAIHVLDPHPGGSQKGRPQEWGTSTSNQHLVHEWRITCDDFGLERRSWQQLIGKGRLRSQLQCNEALWVDFRCTAVRKTNVEGVSNQK